MGDRHGFWTKNDEWISVEEDHFRTILDDPARFGLTREEIEQTFAKHGEEIGSEGRARDEVIQSVTERGWVRVRRYNNLGTRLVIQTTDVATQLPSIPAFIEQLAEHTDVGDDATVVISDYADGESRSFHIGSATETGEVEGDLSGD